LINRILSPSQPIGIFDSGIGGLTVANAIINRLPNEEIIYFGDTAHVPYGDKSADAIRYYCLRIAKFLLEKNCKMIVVACNSASSVGYHVLTDFFKGQALFVNVVDPLVEAAVKGDYKKVGVIATKATTQSQIYPRQLRSRAPNMEVVPLATPLLAPMIEEGYVTNKISYVILENYLSNPGFKDIDAMLLACTHYPLLHSSIEAYFNYRVEVLDSTDVVAEAVYEQLKTHDLLNDHFRHPHQFFVSDYSPSFEETTRIFYKGEIELEQYPMW
jgi:glutamate racemase